VRKKVFGGEDFLLEVIGKEKDAVKGAREGWKKRV
jgi:hypothetical protein